MIRGESIPVYGDGQQVRDWFYVETIARALKPSWPRGAAARPCNTGGDNEWKNLDLLNLLCDRADEALGQPQGTSRKRQTFVTDRLGHDRRYAIDATKIRTELGLSHGASFHQGLAKTVDWYMGRLKG
jgi:dTDP-glucose 4,6-dehydratase